MFRRFVLKNKGSISIFLTIILLPMVTFAGVLVDAARLSSARAMVTSSGDLTMNAALADYDSVLKDVYGLFAMSQNADDPKQALQENLEKYFKNTLAASGIAPQDDDGYTDKLLNQLSSWFSNPDGTKTFDNFMNFDIENFQARYIPESSLATPKVLKREIVEYMKYRAPANIGMSFLDSLSAFGKMRDQTNVVNGKLDADNALEAVNEAASDYYDALKAFNTEFDTFKDGYAGFKSTVEGFRNRYKTEVNRNVLVHLLFEEPAPSYYLNSWSSSNGECHGYKISNSSNSTATSNYDSAVSTLKNMLDNLDKDNDFKAKEQWLKNNTGTSNYKQYVIKYKETGYMDKIKALNSAAYTFDRCYHDKLKEAEEAQKENDENKDTEGYTPLPVNPPPASDHSDLATRANSYLGQAKSISDSASSIYTKYKADIDKRTNDVNAAVSGMKSYINTNLTKIETILGKISAANSEADNVTTAVKELNTKLEAWKGNIDKYGTQDSFQQSMMQEWQNRQNTFNLDEIAAVTTRLNEDKTVLESAKNGLLKFQYGNKLLKDIGSANDAKDAVRSTITAPVDTDADADSKFENIPLFTAGSVPQDTMKKLKDSPMLKFYNYLVVTFGAKTNDDTEKKSKDDFCKQTTEQVKNSEVNKTAPGMSTNEGNFSDLPSKQTSTDDAGDKDKKKTADPEATDSFKEQSGIVNKLFERLAEIGRDSRDKLYVMDYAMNMFSSNITPKELELAQKEDPKLVLKTLSGVPIDAKHNYYYGSEIEYLLYGNPKPSDNVFTAKAQIFAIRFVCNSIYALTNGEIRLMTLPPATAISGLTLGIVPIPVVQVVLELALALAESTYDMTMMADGKKVALFKDKTTWVMSVTGMTNAAVKEITEEAKTAAENVISTGADKAKEALQNLIDSSGEQAKDMTDQLIGDLQVATQAKLEEAAGLVLTQYSTLIGNKLQEATKSLDDTIFASVDAYVENMFKDVDDQVSKFIESGDEVLREVKRLAFKELVSPKEEQLKATIKDAINKMRTNINSAPDTISGIINDAIKSIVNEFKGKVQAITQQIKGIVKTQIDAITSELNAAASQGVDKAKDAMIGVTDKYLTKLGDSIPIGNGDLGSKPSARQALLSFGYKDYLKLFMFIKLCINEDTEMKRIADLIQINICTAGEGSVLQHAKKDGFRMSASYTYVEIQGDIKLKTMFMNIPFITTYAKKTGIGYLDLKYKSLMGY